MLSNNQPDSSFNVLNSFSYPCGLINNHGEILFTNNKLLQLLDMPSLTPSLLKMDGIVEIYDKKGHTVKLNEFITEVCLLLIKSNSLFAPLVYRANLIKTSEPYDIRFSLYRDCILFDLTLIESTKHSVLSDEKIKESNISDEYYKQIVDLANVAIVKFDKNFVITDFTGNSEKVFGFTKKDVIGKTLEETIVPKTESTGRNLDEMINDLVNNTEAYEFNINENMTKSGKRIWMQWHNSTIFDPQGRKQGVLSIGMDISNLIYTEIALKESEERFKTLSDLTFEGIVIHENGKILDCNLSFERQIGYKRKELLGKNLLEIIPAKYHNSIAKELNLNKSQYEAEAIHKNGTLIPISIEAKKTKIGNKSVRVAAVRNISELKKTIYELDKYKEHLEEIVKNRTNEINIQANELIKQNEILEYERNQLRTIIDNIPDFIYIKDTKSRILNANKKLLESLKINSLNDILGKTDYDFFNRPLADKFFHDEKQILDSGLPIFETEEPGNPVNGEQTIISTTKIPLRDSSGKINGIVGIGRDITAKIKAQNRLKIQSEDLKEANLELKQKAKKIEKLNTELKDYNNKLTHANIILNERKEELETTLEQLKQAQSHLIQSEKMASLGVLMAGIAHEINNPVNFVYAGVNSIQKDFADIKQVIDKISSIDDIKESTDQVLRYCQLMNEEDFSLAYQAISETLDDIKIGASRIAEIITGLSRFSRLESEKWKTTNLHVELESVLVLLKNKYKHHIEIKKNYDTHLPEVECYPGKINQVLMNILNNAIDAIENKSGIIDIQTKMVNNKAYISISDTGKGISDDSLSKIFDPFYTTKEVGYGMGLGLAICYTIIQEHQGEIKVESYLDKGTTFTIIIPIFQTN